MQSSAVKTSREARVRATRSAAIRETRPEDYDRIAALHRRNGLSIPPFEHWIGLWTGNPAYSPEDVPLGWVLETERGEIAGSVGNLPLAYEFRGRALTAATAYGWVVDEAYRSYSVMILSRFLRQSGVDLFVFTTVGDKAEPIYSAGFQLSRVPVGAWNRSAFWITNYRGFSRSLLNRRGTPFAGAMRSCLALGFCLWDRWHGRSIPAAAHEYRVEFCSEFDRRFDDFWETLRRENPHLLAVRNRETLEWHFRGARPSILAIFQGSRMVAYAIFSRQDNSALDFEWIRFVDFQALEGHSAAVSTALQWMLRRCRRDGLDALEVMGDWLHRTGLPRIDPPYRRTLSSWTFYYKAADPELAEALRDPAAWIPSSFDGDASL